MKYVVNWTPLESVSGLSVLLGIQVISYKTDVTKYICIFLVFISTDALPIPAPNLGEGIPLPIFNFGAGILSPYQIFSNFLLARV